MLKSQQKYLKSRQLLGLREVLGAERCEDHSNSRRDDGAEGGRWARDGGWGCEGEILGLLGGLVNGGELLDNNN